MAENFKHLYEQTKKMLEKYQDEIVPGFRAEIEELKAKLAAYEEKETALKGGGDNGVN